ncbi:HNH endonuclease [Roseomonas sp. E05]|uniref:HNH endonuclease n=1 Tax=Roseomonas sp. E05 TaxID=3046310 RepID=UPI0024B99FF4|nr:HNH endonuclease [Roseomonas sp. E05]MDJ0391637.1 HNH endonuclease [Roseomonas sp. E05]
MNLDYGLEHRHIIGAMKKIEQEGIPARARSTRYDVLRPDDGTPFPPKLVLSIAAELASGKALPRTAFSGGEETNAVLRALDFSVVEKGRWGGSETPDALHPGDVLTNDQLSRVFGVGNAGGMRWSSARGCLMVIADHTKALYDDRWEENVLHYTGMGRIGHQQLEGQNKRLAEQRETGVPVHLFEVFRRGSYVYAGQVRLADAAQTEQQPDDEGRVRQVYIFPLRLEGGGKRPVPEHRDLEEIETERARRLAHLSTEELARRAALGGRQRPGAREVRTAQYDRDPAVAELAKRLARGICDLCGRPAPFAVDGVPYLECHHVVHLAKDGPDTIENAVALCPNCHRRMHALDRPADRKKLLSRIATRVMPPAGG